MKTGILTFHRALNYGAVLQAYALRKTICDLGHDCEVIDYGIIGQEPRINLSFNGFKPFIASVLINLLSYFNADIRRSRFSKFRRNYLKTSTKRYLSNTDIKESIKNYDAFVTGSDQVWNPYLSNNDNSYFLDFVSVTKTKISYAASFGLSKIPVEVKKEYALLINRFNSVSVRESEGKEIIKELIGRDSELVLDPTFLLTGENWLDIANPVSISGPYILCFVIMADPPGFMDFCHYLKKITGYKIIRVVNPKYKLDFSLKIIASAGPLEFLGLMKNASIVVTNSFHGTAFSIIFKKPFYTFLYNNDRDIRLKEITQKLGLSDRLICNRSQQPLSESINIDYTEPYKILQIEIHKSVNFLKNSLTN